MDEEWSIVIIINNKFYYFLEFIILVLLPYYRKQLATRGCMLQWFSSKAQRETMCNISADHTDKSEHPKWFMMSMCWLQWAVLHDENGCKHFLIVYYSWSTMKTWRPKNCSSSMSDWVHLMDVEDFSYSIQLCAAWKNCNCEKRQSLTSFLIPSQPIPPHYLTLFGLTFGKEG